MTILRWEIDNETTKQLDFIENIFVTLYRDSHKCRRNQNNLNKKKSVIKTDLLEILDEQNDCEI